MDQHTASDKKTQTAALIVSMISAFFNTIGNSGLNVALPAIGREMNMGAVALGWVATSMLLSSTMLVVPFGRLADIYGRKKLMVIGSALYTLASVFVALSASPAMLIASRVIQGIGSAMIFGTSVAILTSVYPPERRGWALGWNVSAVYLGLTAGPFIGGILTNTLGWRWIFWINIPLGLAALALLVLLLKGEWADAKGEKLDITGSAILALLIGCFVYGLSRMPSVLGGALVAAGVVLTVVFIKFEDRQAAPVVNVKLFEGNTVFTFSNLATLIHYSSAFAVSFFLSLYLQYIKGMTPAQAGMVLMAQPAVMVLVAPIAGRLSDKRHPGNVASVGMAATMTGLFLFTFLGMDTPLSWIIWCLVFIGAGFGLFSSPNTNAVMSSVERRHYGLASGIVSTMRQVGQMTGLAIGTMMLSIFVGHKHITPAEHPAFLTSVRVSFTVFTVLCFLGIFASLARGKKVA